jgi:large repetitive protein
MGMEGRWRAIRRFAAVWAVSSLAAVGSLSLVEIAVAAGSPVDVSPPTIAGTAKDGAKLEAAKGAWSGEKPIVYAYQWARCDASGEECEGILSATKGSHKLTHEDVGHTLRVTVTASDDSGGSSATSAPTGVIVALAPVRRAAPRISGALEDGQLLSVSGGAWKGTPPLSFTYQWEACEASGANCSVLTGASGSSYRVTSSQLGGRLRAIVTATNAGGSTSATSRVTKKIKPGPPVNTAAPVITGGLQEGQTLSAGAGTWAGTAPLAFTYRWERCSVLVGGCEGIPGATSATYSLGPLDTASKLVVLVTAGNAQGSATASSAETSPILALLPSNIVPPGISGTLKEGQLLSVGTGTWSGTEPISYSYQWRLCDPLGEACAEIAGATGPSLKLSSLEIGKTLDVVVKATNVAGSSSVTTSLTGLIEGLLPVNSVLPSISGLLKEGGLLSVGTGSWSGSEPISYSYQWQLCGPLGEACKNISEATASALGLIAPYVGDTVDVVVRATNVAGSITATSSVSSPILGIAPVNTALPAISGLLEIGKVLSVSNGSWSGTTPMSFKYQWQLCLLGSCTNIGGATGATLTLLGIDVGDTLDALVTATNVTGSSSATSKQTERLLGIL